MSYTHAQYMPCLQSHKSYRSVIVISVARDHHKKTALHSIMLIGLKADIKTTAKMVKQCCAMSSPNKFKCQ